MWSEAWKDVVPILGSAMPRCDLSRAWVCNTSLEMLVRSLGEVLQCISVMPQLFAFLLGCFRTTPLLLYSRPIPLLLLCVLHVSPSDSCL